MFESSASPGPIPSPAAVGLFVSFLSIVLLAWILLAVLLWQRHRKQQQESWRPGELAFTISHSSARAHDRQYSYQGNESVELISHHREEDQLSSSEGGEVHKKGVRIIHNV